MGIDFILGRFLRPVIFRGEGDEGGGGGGGDSGGGGGGSSSSPPAKKPGRDLDADLGIGGTRPPKRPGRDLDADLGIGGTRPPKRPGRDLDADLGIGGTRPRPRPTPPPIFHDDDNDRPSRPSPSPSPSPSPGPGRDLDADLGIGGTRPRPRPSPIPSPSPSPSPGRDLDADLGIGGTRPPQRPGRDLDADLGIGSTRPPSRPDIAPVIPSYDFGRDLDADLGIGGTPDFDLGLDLGYDLGSDLGLGGSGGRDLDADLGLGGSGGYGLGRDLGADLGIGGSGLGVTSSDLLNGNPDILELGSIGGGSLTSHIDSPFMNGIIDGTGTVEDIIGSLSLGEDVDTGDGEGLESSIGEDLLSLGNILDPKIFNFSGDNFIYGAREDIPYGVSATKNARPFENIVFHHTGNNYPAENQVAYGQRYDPDRGGRFGYHFVVDKDGTIIQGAPMDVRTNHILSSDLKDGYKGVTNSNSIGISLVGGGDDDFTPAQVAAARKLADQLRGSIDTISGVYGQGAIQNGKVPTEGVALADLVNSGGGEDVGLILSDISEPVESILDSLGDSGDELVLAELGDLVPPILDIEDVVPSDRGPGRDLDADLGIGWVGGGDSGPVEVVTPDIEETVVLTPEDEDLGDAIIADVLEGYEPPPSSADIPEISGFERFMMSLAGSFLPFGDALTSWALEQRENELSLMGELLDSGEGRAVYNSKGEVMGVYDLNTGEYIGMAGPQFGAGGQELKEGDVFVSDTDGGTVSVDIKEPPVIESGGGDSGGGGGSSSEGEDELEELLSGTPLLRNVDRGVLTIPSDRDELVRNAEGLIIRRPSFANGGVVMPELDSFLKRNGFG